MKTGMMTVADLTVGQMFYQGGVPYRLLTKAVKEDGKVRLVFVPANSPSRDRPSMQVSSADAPVYGCPEAVR